MIVSLMVQVEESWLRCRLSQMNASCGALLEQRRSRRCWSGHLLGGNSIILLVLVASWSPAVEMGHLFLVFSCLWWLCHHEFWGCVFWETLSLLCTLFFLSKMIHNSLTCSRKKQSLLSNYKIESH